MKNFIKNNKILIIILSIITSIRIYLAVKIPLYIQAGAGYDDFLFIDYAKELLKGNWLGDFNYVTLAKSASFSVFIAINNILGIPYSVGLIGIYIIAIIVFIVAIKKIITNKYALSLLYAFLLFSPVMFHVENVQKIYRGGLIVSFSLLVIGSAIGLYTRRRESLKTMSFWSVLLTISLTFFWYIKEDSIWILPFVITAIIIIILDYAKNKKLNNILKRIIICIVPIVCLFASNIIFCSINYIKYGEYTITDRTGTYFKSMISDIIKIEDKSNDNMNIWITKKMMNDAMSVSPTLKSVKPQIDDMYKNSWAVRDYGEIEGDIIDWSLKEAFRDAGIYSKGGKYTNNFYKKIHTELLKGFKSGKIKQAKGIYLSSMATGFEKKEFDYLNDITPKSIKMLYTYSENETGLYAATGDMDKIALCNYLTNSTFIWPESENIYTGQTKIYVSIINKIVDFYRNTGTIIFFIGIIGLIFFIIKSIIDFINKKYDNFSILLIIVGIILTCMINLIGVEWFCSWCRDLRHIYNYTCGIVPFIQIIEFFGIYYLFKYIIDYKNNIFNKKI